MRRWNSFCYIVLQLFATLICASCPRSGLIAAQNPATSSQPSASLYDQAMTLLRSHSPADQDRARTLLEQDIQQNNPLSAVALAQLLLERPKDNSDVPQALGLLQKAADAGSLDAKEYLCSVLFQGVVGIDTDREAGVHMAEEVVKARPNSLRANRILGMAMMSGIGFPQDSKKAMEPLTIAANQDDLWSIKVMSGFCEAAGDNAEAMKWLEKAIGLKDTASMRRAAAMLVKGTKGVERDSQKARVLLQEAVGAKDTTAMAELAQFELAGYLPTKDTTEIVKWATAAGDAECGLGMYVLSVCYAKGIGVNQDEKSRRQWLLKAFDASNADASFELGQIYETGNGVDVDLKLALYYYDLAAQRGHFEGSIKASHLKKPPDR